MQSNKLFLRLVSLFFALAFISPLFFGGVNTVKAEESQKSITVFSSEDYIDESILDDFEEDTGIHVNYITFATNEEMYNELLKDKHAVDLICVSEYMIMKMKEEKLIKEFSTPENFSEYGSEYIKDKFKTSPLELMTEDEEKTYAICYMWGTLGMIYNVEKVEDSSLLDSWASIWDNFENKVTIKDSIRDTYFMALAKVYQEELQELKSDYENGDIDTKTYNEKVTEIFNRTDKDTIDKVGDELLDLKNNIYGFEVDAGKSDILTGKIDVNVAWSGDAVYAIDQGLFDEEGNELDEQVILGYAVPKEGSNVWFDGYVMTEFADEENSLMFLDYLCDPEIAVSNMDYTGYTSCIVGETVFDYVYDCYNDEESENEIDLAYFFDPNGEIGGDYIIKVAEGLEYMFYAQYPTEDVLNRCAIMKNFSGEELEMINDMWKKVKLITLSKTAVALIIVGILVVIIAIVLIKNKDFILEKLNISFDRKKKSKYKVVKKEIIK